MPLVFLSLLGFLRLSIGSVEGKDFWVGIRNPGNYCYRNSLLQVLFHLPGLDFCDLVRNRDIQHLHQALCDAQRHLLTSESVCSLDYVNTALVAYKDALLEDGPLLLPFSTPARQNDPAELLVKLNEVLNYELKLHVGSDRIPVSVRSQFSVLDFAVTVQTRFECRTCHTSSYQEVDGEAAKIQTPFFININLVPENCDIDLLESLRLSLEGEQIKFCAHKTCGKNTPHTNHYEIMRFPQYLLIQVLRFDNNLMKQLNKIQAPLNGMVIPGHSHSAKPTYSLHGVIEHVGDYLGVGHFKARVKTRTGWYEFNDSTATPLTEADMITYAAASEGYLFMYVRD